MFEIQRQGQVLISTLTGSMGKVKARQFIHRFGQIRDELAPAPWAHIADLRDWGLTGPEAATMLTAFHQVNINSQLSVAATLLNPSFNSLQSWAVKGLFQVTPGQIEYQEFVDADALITWLGERGYEVTPW